MLARRPAAVVRIQYLGATAPDSVRHRHPASDQYSGALVAAGRDEDQEVPIGDRMRCRSRTARSSTAWRGPLVVVRRRAIVGADLDRAAGEPHHLPPSGATAGSRGAGGAERASGVYGRALLELERLEDRLVVLVLVLQHHVVDEAVVEQRIGRRSKSQATSRPSTRPRISSMTVRQSASPGSASAPRVLRGCSNGLYSPGISTNSIGPSRFRVSQSSSKCAMWPRSQMIGLISGSCWRWRSSSERGATSRNVRARASCNCAAIAPGSTRPDTAVPVMQRLLDR